MKKYLLDTNIIITALNNGMKLPRYEFLISIITEIELLSYSNLTLKDEEMLKKLLSNFKIVNITDEIKDKTITIRRNSKIKLPDSLIIATAIVENATLITADKQLLNCTFVDAINLNNII